jgi:2-phospho-L-lactate guanylyltransferase
VILVPFDARRPKTRLAPLLDADERRAFADAMRADVLAALADADAGEVRLLATAPVEASVPVDVDDRPLTAAVNAVLDAADDPVTVVAADLPLLDAAAVERLLAAGGEGRVALAAGRGGGTNGLLAGHPDFRVDYHGVSCRDHREAAAAVGATVVDVDSRRLATDVDEPADLVEVLVHGPDTRAGRWLADAGVELVVDDGRATVERG